VLTLERAATAAAWRLVCARGVVQAAQVVLATNGYTDDLWPTLRRTIVPVYGSIAASAPLGAVAGTILPAGSVLYETGPITVYYRIDAHRRLLIGGRGPQRDVDSPAALGHLLDYARALWPSLAGVHWAHVWSGRLAMTPDQYPHIHELAPGVIACLGYNGRGVALATAMGAALARRLTQPEEPFDMPVTALRPIRLHRLWPLAVRLVIARGRLGEWAQVSR
jgi:glycine/D-amino acid oxidase-like deaminating enzyme